MNLTRVGVWGKQPAQAAGRLLEGGGRGGGAPCCRYSLPAGSGPRMWRGVGPRVLHHLHQCCVIKSCQPELRWYSASKPKNKKNSSYSDKPMHSNSWGSLLQLYTTCCQANKQLRLQGMHDHHEVVRVHMYTEQVASQSKHDTGNTVVSVSEVQCRHIMLAPMSASTQ